MTVTSPWSKSFIKRCLQFLWILPFALLGMLALGIMLVMQKHSRLQIEEGAIEVVVEGWFAEWMWKKNWAAWTAGWCLFYWTAQGYHFQTRIHERVHVEQGLRYGIFHPILYTYYQLKYGYDHNPMELEAYRRDGSG